MLYIVVQKTRKPKNTSGRHLRTHQPHNQAIQIQSPHSPRANPFPEVTDPFCRLPLRTLFYQPEAVNLGDLLRFRYGCELLYKFNPFSRAPCQERIPKWNSAEYIPISLLDGFPLANIRQKEKKPLPDPAASVGVELLRCRIKEKELTGQEHHPASLSRSSL